MPNYTRTAIVQQQKSNTPKAMPTPKKDWSQLYKKWQAEQQAKQQAYASAQAQRVADARAKAQADARARAQAQEAQARAQEQAERTRQRSEAMRQRRLERKVTHRVSRQDTPETIAERYKTTPQSVVSRAGVDRLRAGQVIPVYEPLREVTVEKPYLHEEARLAQEDRTTTAIPETMGAQEWANLRRQEELQKLGDAQLMQYYTDDPRPIGEEEVDKILTYGAENVGVVPDRVYTQDSWQRNDVWEYQQKDIANQKNYQKQLTIRWTGQAVQYVAGMVDTGQMSWEDGRNIFRNTEMVVDDNGNVTYKLGDKWMTFTTDEFLELPQTTQEQLFGLGWQPNGLGQVVPVMLEDEGFGMGGYSYDGGYGYGGGGYGGGGGYEPKARSSSPRSTESGGRYRETRQSITAGSVPPAHWRI